MSMERRHVKVMIIEDDTVYAGLLKQMLSDVAAIGYDVETAHTLKDGLSILKKFPFDIVLLDLNLPDSEGMITAAQVNQHFPDLAIVIVTGAYTDEMGIEAISNGVQDYFIKGKYDMHVLDKSILYAVERKKTEKQIMKYVRESELQQWGMQKTNDAIKILYKELKKTNDRLTELDRLKSDFVSIVSHELRTPLTAIKEGISIVLEGLSGDVNEEQKDFLSIAKRNVDRLHRLINDVLDFAKLESGTVEFNMAKNDINTVVAEVVQLQEAVAKEKGLYIKLQFGEDVPNCNFDHDRLIQVLTNLINNAIKYTSEGGITIETYSDSKSNSIVVKVSDTGGGIKEEDLERLFYKFQQLGSPRDRKTGGTGLGLVICREIIERHGGRIWVESQYQRGSDFIFSLPIA